MGISSFMTVNEECSELSVLAANGGNDALLRSQTFLLTEQDFIQTIVHASTDESDPSGSDQANGLGIGPVPPMYSEPLAQVGAMILPDPDAGPVVPAVCEPACNERKKRYALNTHQLTLVENVTSCAKTTL